MFVALSMTCSCPTGNLVQRVSETIAKPQRCSRTLPSSIKMDISPIMKEVNGREHR
jgi:hypothetical protein